MSAPELIQDHGLLRFLTCGSVDDGKSTLIGRLLFDTKTILADTLSAIAAHLGKARPGRGRPVAAHRRPAGRARTGHHHRRRLPLLRHRHAQVHHRRRAGPRAVHAQHGHRRLDRQPGHHPDRCAQGRADADPPPLLAGASGRHPAPGRRHQQDGPGRLFAGRPSSGSGPTTSNSPPRSASRTCASSRCRRSTATWSSTAATRWTGTRARRCWKCSKPRPARTAEHAETFRFPVQYVCRPQDSANPDLHDYRGFMGRVESGAIEVGDAVTVLPSGLTSTVTGDPDRRR